MLKKGKHFLSREFLIFPKDGRKVIEQNGQYIIDTLIGSVRHISPISSLMQSVQGRRQLYSKQGDSHLRLPPPPRIGRFSTAHSSVPQPRGYHGRGSLLPGKRSPPILGYLQRPQHLTDVIPGPDYE